MSDNTPEAVDPSASWSFETKQIHVGQPAGGDTKARALPIYQTTSYTFDNTDHAAALFGLAEPGNIYTRIMNPTQDAVEQRIASLEGGVAALLLSSGQAAETFAILNLAGSGDHIVSSPYLYGGTYNLFHYTLPKLGIEVSFVEDPDDLDQWRDAVRPTTRAFYGETIANPKNHILDISGISGVAHDNGLPLIVDNTVATPYLLRPLEHGADIVVHSATKFIGGHGDVIGGVVATAGPTGTQWAERLRRTRAITGALLHPLGAYLLHRGLQTLPVRVHTQSAAAHKVAVGLVEHAEVEHVFYPGLGGDCDPRGLVGTQMSAGGAVLSFTVRGGYEQAKRVTHGVRLIGHAVSLGGVDTLIQHPAALTHRPVTGDAAPSRALLRLSVGLEDPEDVAADLQAALEASALN